MNSSGISRRIDELGRIVIPIEIRRLLNIKEGDNLEFIINSDYVSLRKINIVDTKLKFLEYISKTIESIIVGDYLITNRERVLFSSDNSNLNKKIVTIQDNYETSIIDGKDMGINSKLYVFPFIIENNVSGFIILYNIENIDKYKMVIKFICSYIQNTLTLS